jgi:hypothetical protein
MIFGFGYFLVRLLDEKKISENDCNTIIGNINAAGTSEAILDVTVKAPDSLWQRTYIGPEGQLQLIDIDKEPQEEPKDGYQPFCVNRFEIDGVLLRDENILAHVMHCLCYGKKSMQVFFRTLYVMCIYDSKRKMATLATAWCYGIDYNISETPIILPVHKASLTGPNDYATALYPKEIATRSQKLKNTKYLHILDCFLELQEMAELKEWLSSQDQQEETSLTLQKTQQTQQRQETLTTTNKKAIFIFVFAGLVILSLAIIAAANIISWANLIKIALLSSIAAKTGIAAAGIVIGGVLLFFANRLRYKKNVFVCPCDKSCRKRCARGENSQEELLVRTKDIAQ